MTQRSFLNCRFLSRLAASCRVTISGNAFSVGVIFSFFLLVAGQVDTLANEPAVQKVGSDEISVGAPVQIPLTKANRPTTSATEETSTETPTPDHPTATQPAAATTATEVVVPPTAREPAEEATETADTATRSSPRAAPRKAAGTPQPGWLGLIVDDSLVTGRLVIVEVTEPSPAHEVGIKPQDVLLAIDGQQLQSADQLAALLSAISPQKEVRALIGRPDGVNEVTMTAIQRPAATRSPATVELAEAAENAAASTPPPRSRFSRPSETGQPSGQTPSPADTRSAAGLLRADTQSATGLRADARSAAGIPTTPPAATTAPTASQPSRSRFSRDGGSRPAALPAPQALPLAQSPQPQAPPPQAPLNEQPFSPPSLQGPAVGGRTALGVRTLPIDLAIQSRYQLPEASGAYVIGVIESLPASQAGLPPGSVIVAFDNRPVRSPAELNSLVTGSPPGRLVAVQYVLPGGRSHQAEVELQRIDPALEEALVGVPITATQPTGSIPRTAQRLPTQPPALALEEVHMLTEEVDMLRQEVLRLRSRLDRLEGSQPAPDRVRGALTR